MVKAQKPPEINVVRIQAVMLICPRLGIINMVMCDGISGRIQEAMPAIPESGQRNQRSYAMRDRMHDAARRAVTPFIVEHDIDLKGKIAYEMLKEERAE